MPAHSPKLREIERLRAVAVLLVVLSHYAPVQRLLPAAFVGAWSGVDLFFVISGYVVTLSLLRLLPPLEDAPDLAVAFERAKNALRRFYIRRLYRIVPAAGTAILLHRLFVALFPYYFGNAKDWLTEVVCFFGGIYNYTMPVTGSNQLGVYWSLSVEEHFYLLLPFLFVAFRTAAKRVAASVVIILVIVVVVRPFAHPDVTMANLDYYERCSSHLRFDSLFAGVVLALLGSPTKRALLSPRLVRFVLVPAALFLLTYLPGSAPMYVMRRVGFVALWSISALLVGYAAADRGYVLEVPGLRRVLEYIGSRSYAIYLIHYDILRLDLALRDQWPAYGRLVGANTDRAAFTAFVAFFALTLLICELMYRFVEQPCIALGRAVTRDAELGEETGVRAQPRLRTGLRWALAGTLCVATTLLNWHVLASPLGKPNIALHAPVAASTYYEGSHEAKLTNGVLEDVNGQCTEPENRPWLEIDLGHVRALSEVRVFNRSDGWYDSQLPLDISVSKDHASFEQVGHRERLFSQVLPWRLGLHGVEARWVRFQVNRDSQLCLTEAEVYAQK